MTIIFLIEFPTALKLTANEMERVLEWINQRDQTFSSFLLSFIARDEDIYPRYMFYDSMNKVSASKWWAIMTGLLSGKEGEFCQLMANVHSCPSSSVGFERISKILGRIRNEQSCDLGSEQVVKLVNIYNLLNT